MCLASFDSRGPCETVKPFRGVGAKQGGKKTSNKLLIFSLASIDIRCLMISQN